MRRRQKAADFFPSEATADQQSNTEQSVEENTVAGGRATELRRSSRLQSASPVPGQRISNRKSVGQEAKKISPGVANTTPVASTSRTHTRKLSNESQSTNEFFVDAQDQFATPRMFPQVEITVVKSPLMDELYVSAVEDIEDTPREGQDLSGSLEEVLSSITVQSTPRATQNTLENIPSSQPRPRSQRSPLPLIQPIPSSTPPASFPTSTSVSEEIKSTITSIQIQPPHPESTTPSDSNNADKSSSLSDDDDDEAPEPISLSLSRSQALESQSKISQQTKTQASKIREKRRHRDILLATQKRQKLEQEKEISNSQQSNISTTGDNIQSGNTTDTPAPNQDHQASRIAKKHQALPVEILKAASETWLKSEKVPVSQKQQNVAGGKKRKERDNDDGGIRILEEMNLKIAPKAGKIGVSKEKMIMQMGRGERRMFIGRFAK